MQLNAGHRTLLKNWSKKKKTLLKSVVNFFWTIIGAEYNDADSVIPINREHHVVEGFKEKVFAELRETKAIECTIFENFNSPGAIVGCKYNGF